MESVTIRRRLLCGAVLCAALVLLGPATVHAHGMSARDTAFFLALRGMAIGLLMYLGAKHMVTGYDHILFFIGVIFFLYRSKDVL